MLMTSVGEPECLLNGIPGGLSQRHWARVSRYTHTWGKPSPAGTHGHAQAVTWGASPCGAQRGTGRLQLPVARGGGHQARRGSGIGAWAREPLQAHCVGD